jgi:hypothetical protein
MQVLRMSMGCAALLAFLAGCGGPPDDVTQAARDSRAATSQSSSRPATISSPRAAAPQSQLMSSSESRDRSTATMGAGPAEPAVPVVQAGAPAAPASNDSVITTRVRTAIVGDREVGALRIDVDTRDGIVTLSGAVPTAAARARATELAKNVKDVKSVNDQLTLASG